MVNGQLILKSTVDSSAVCEAQIVLKNNGVRLVSDKNGMVELRGSTDSIYHIVITHPSFEEIDLYTGNKATVYLIPLAYEIETYVATGELTEKKNVKDVISNVRVIKESDIKNTGSQNLGDILKYQPNIKLSNDPVLGTSVSMNGIGGQNIKLLKNGVTVTGAMNGSVDVSQLDVNNISQIEIIDGPMSLLYGSNALAGTINMINKLPSKKTSLKVKGHTETTGIFNTALFFNQMLGKNYLSLHLGRNFFDGWSPGNAFFYSPVNTTADTGRFSLWKPREQLVGDVSFLIPLTKRMEIKFITDVLNEKIVSNGLPKAPYYETAFDDYFRTFRNINSIEYNYKGKKFKHNTLASFSYFNRVKNTYLNDLTMEGKGIPTSPENQDTTRLVTSQVRYITQTRICKVDLNLGIDANHEGFYGRRVIEDQKSIRNISFIAVGSYNLNNRFDFKFGLRQTLHSLDKIPLIPSFSTKIKLNRNTEIKFSAGKGFRSPGVKELYMYFVDINHNIVGNEHLKSESSGNISLGFITKVFDRNPKSLVWHLNSYYNSFKNLITLAALSPTEYTYINIGESRNAGINSEWKYRGKRFDASLQNAFVAMSNNNEEYKNPAYFPTFNAGIQAGYNFLKRKNLGVHGFVNYFGRSPSMYVQDNQPVTVNSQPYWMIDITGNYGFKISKLNLNLNFGLRNLNNVTNITSVAGAGGVHQIASNQRLISTGRSMFLSLECIL